MIKLSEESKVPKYIARIITDPITLAEQRLIEWRKWLDGFDDDIKKMEGYTEGVSTALESLGIDKDGTVSKLLDFILKIGKGIYYRSEEAFEALHLSINMSKNLKHENEVLRESITLMLELPSNADKETIITKANEYGGVFRYINGRIKDEEKRGRAIGT